MFSQRWRGISGIATRHRTWYGENARAAGARCENYEPRAGNFEAKLEIVGAHDFAAVCFDRAALRPGKQPAIAHIVAMRKDGGGR